MRMYSYRDRRRFHNFQEPAPGSHSMLKNGRLPVNRIYIYIRDEIKIDKAYKRRLFPTPSCPYTSMDGTVAFASRLFLRSILLVHGILFVPRGQESAVFVVCSVARSRLYFIEIPMSDNDARKKIRRPYDDTAGWKG